MSNVKKYNVEVVVMGGNIEKSIRQFRKKLEREGVSRDIKRQAYFERPTQKRRKVEMRAIKNNILKMYESLLA
jgi:small subunit ribosomal protein S21